MKNKPRRGCFVRVVSFLGNLIYVLLVLGLLASIGWSGVGVAEAVVRRAGEQIDYAQVADSYPQVATQLVAVQLPGDSTPVPTVTLTAEPSATPEASETPTASNTPTETATSTETATDDPTETATHTDTPQPSATEEPTGTDQPTETATFTDEPADTPTDEPTITPLVIAQAFEFATNTPRAIEVTIPALNTVAPPPTADVPPTATLPPTATPPPTATLPPTATPTMTFTPTETQAPATETPRPLPTILLPQSAEQDEAAPTAIPTTVPLVNREYDLLNIILLGSDEEITNDNVIRTDTMIVVSINRDTGTVSMLAIPRDLFVYVPGLGMRRINVAFGWGEAVGWTGGGFGLLRQTIIYNLGINVHYYAKVTISELEEIVDLLGGINIAVDCAIQDFYPVVPEEELDLTRPIEENYYLRTLDVGYYALDGFDAQWYARSRRNSSDFDRGRRQQQVLRAIFRKARDNGQLQNLPNLWSEGLEIVETNLGFDDMLALLPLALSLELDTIENFTFIPTYHTQSWTTPDGSNVQLPNYDTLLPLMQDFYTPPTNNQTFVERARILVYNGTPSEDLDRVAAERLGYSGFGAIAAGNAEQAYAETVVIDRTGQSKGSSLREIADILNVRPENILSEPDPNREADFEVYLGTGYNSCTFGVLPPDPVVETVG